MKLYNTLKEQVDSLGDVKYAWFTSFNLSIEFVEKYVLSAVLQMDPPRTRHDYELMQGELNSPEKKIDFRIFCDNRFVNSGEVKRTAIPVHGFSPSRDRRFSQQSLFHPKVIYLEGHNGRMIVGAGSANLTISGWGRNQEVFQFYEIRTLDQYKAVRGFFENVFGNAEVDCPLGIRRGFKDENPSWSFVHSFQDRLFLEQLFDDRRHNQLLAWSPYLPRDLPGYIRRLREAAGVEELKVALVTDRLDGKYIRTEWTPDLEAMLENQTVTFYENPTTPHPNVELCHAKVWKLPGKLAIGSWNFTGPGSNSFGKDDERAEENNIEAGFIINEKRSAEDAIGAPIRVSQDDFASVQQLDDVKLEVPEELPFDLRVSFDWRNLSYAIEGKWATKARDEGYAIKLPDIASPIAAPIEQKTKKWRVEPRLVSEPQELLYEHFFDVVRDRKVVYRGIVIEEGLEYRRSLVYESLGDLLDALVFDEDLDTSEKIVCKIPENDRGDESEDHDGGPSGGNPEEDPTMSPSSSSDVSYFRLFKAISRYGALIDGAGDEVALTRLVFQQPGCLSELVEKANASISPDKCDREVFNWFLAQEVNSLCARARKRWKSLRVKGSAALLTRLENLKITPPALPSEIQAGYVELIERECGYAE